MYNIIFIWEPTASNMASDKDGQEIFNFIRLVRLEIKIENVNILWLRIEHCLTKINVKNTFNIWQQVCLIYDNFILR